MSQELLDIQAVFRGLAQFESGRKGPRTGSQRTDKRLGQ